MALGAFPLGVSPSRSCQQPHKTLRMPRAGYQAPRNIMLWIDLLTAISFQQRLPLPLRVRLP